MSAITQTDLANVAILLQRLRTGELTTAKALEVPDQDSESCHMLKRVEAYLTEGIRRMDTPIGDGGPAFPCEWDNINTNHAAACGMSLRDYAAIKFAAGILANPDHGDYLHEHDTRAKIALAAADAYLKARQS